MKKLTKEQMEIVKREHPEWFNGIEVGKWYFKQYDRGSSIIFFCQGHRNGDAYGYGIDTSSNGKTEWLSDSDVVESNNDGFREATPEEVKQALIAETKRRYKIGDNIKGGFKGNGAYDFILTRGADMAVYIKNENQIRIQFGMNNNISAVVFENGQWASVIPQEKPSLQDDIQALRDKHPDYNFTIVAEAKA